MYWGQKGLLHLRPPWVTQWVLGLGFTVNFCLQKLARQLQPFHTGNVFGVADVKMKWVCVFMTCMWMFMHVHACSCMHMAQSICGSHGITMGVSPRLPPCLRQGRLLFAALCPGDAGRTETLVLYSSPHKTAGVTSKLPCPADFWISVDFLLKVLGKYMDTSPPPAPAQSLDLQSAKQWWQEWGTQCPGRTCGG